MNHFLEYLFINYQIVDQCIVSSKEWLGWKDLNLRMPESKSGALDHFATPQYNQTSVKSLNRQLIKPHPITDENLIL